MGAAVSSHTGEESILDRFRAPTESRSQPIPIDPALAETREVVRLVRAALDAAPSIRSTGVGHVHCRRANEKPETVGSRYVDPEILLGDFEKVLHEQNLHVMIHDAHRYHPAAAETVAALEDVLRRQSGGARIHRVMAGLFVSAPGAKARLHDDPEHVWMQHLRGEKVVHVYDRKAAERVKGPLYRDEAKTRDFLEEQEPVHTAACLRPGDSLTIPARSPHWVQNGDSLNVSLSLGFFDDEALRSQKIERFERWTHGRGLKLPVRSSPVGRTLGTLGFDVLSRLGRIRLDY